MAHQISVATVLAALLLTATLVVAQQPRSAESQRPAATLALQNPVPADASSVAAGKQLYVRHCRGCHGPTGKGDGSMALGTRPPSLVEPTLRHGSSDGEIFTIIRGGGANMDAYKEAIPEPQVWHLVNYIQSLRSVQP